MAAENTHRHHLNTKVPKSPIDVFPNSWAVTKADMHPSRQLAADYRKLTVQGKTADEESKKLKLLENQLREVVTQAFNAQVQLQRVRLQLAALELSGMVGVGRCVPTDATSLPTAPRR
jgi:hypothetical protein